MPAFPPIMGQQAHSMILGSMPSRASLAQQQYYANPRNTFWWIISNVFEIDQNLSYSDRAQALADKGVVVWDVLFDCERPGSLDSAIKRDSEVVNDFELFFTEQPELNRAILKGAMAEKIFRRHFPLLFSSNSTKISWYRCPSTSPAHASMSARQKLDEWRQAFLR